MNKGLSWAEAMTSTPGEILDLMAAEAIAKGARQKIKYSFNELLQIK